MKSDFTAFSDLSVAEQKRRLRAELKLRYGKLSESLQAEYSTAICRHLASLRQFVGAERILLYYPTRHEVNLLPLFELARTLDKTVYLPRCRVRDRSMIFLPYTGEESLAPSVYGIPEPTPTSGSFPIKYRKNDLCVFPGLAFSVCGERLGKGGGYYDRFSVDFPGYTVGVCYDDFLLPSLPTEPNDRPVQAIITEKGVTVST